MTASSRRPLLRALLLRLISTGERSENEEGDRVRREAEEALTILMEDGAA